VRFSNFKSQWPPGPLHVALAASARAGRLAEKALISGKRFGKVAFAIGDVVVPRQVLPA
jgi:hypothetical protein